MQGRIDESGRTLNPIKPGRPGLSESRMLDAWIDTGFTGDLVLPGAVIDACDLPVFGIASAVLADGSEIEVQTHTCQLDWFGSEKTIEVIRGDGEFPLLGIGLLLGLELTADFRNLRLSLSPKAKDSDTA